MQKIKTSSQENNQSLIETHQPPSQSNTGEISNTKHRHCPQCLNKCINWKLQGNLAHKNGTYSYSFDGSSLFFKKLETSILNILQVNYVSNTDRSPTKSCLKAYSNNSAEQLKPPSDNDNSKPEAITSLYDYLNIKFPIDNSELNFMILDANLGVAANLNNIFFLEFDLNSPSANKNNSKESLKMIREINDYCVDREIMFTLNGTLHDVPLFKSDLKFSVEYRKFIKSIQFRIETYKNQVKDKRRCNNNNGNWRNEKKTYYTRNNFYAKILSNINLGIEFTKPINDGYENCHTNFNSIVNSYIQINKLYLEVCIPKMFINNNINISSMKSLGGKSSESNNITKNNKEKDDDKEKVTENSLSSTSEHLGYSNNNNNNDGNGNENKITYTSETFNANNNISNQSIGSNIMMPVPPMPFQNDFNRMLFKQQNSPTMTIRNNLSLNSKYYRNFNGSPHCAKQMNNIVYSPSGYLSPLMPQFIPGIPTISSPMGIPQPPVGNQPPYPYQGQRKFSEQVSNKLKENPLSAMSGPSNLYGQPPMRIPFNNDDLISPMSIHNSFISPRDIHKMSFNFPSPSNNYMGMNPPVHTIHQKILDWENTSTITDNQISQIKREYKQKFLSEYEGKSNFTLFIQAATPYIEQRQIDNLNKMDLMKYFSYFSRSSLFGLDLSYCIEGDICTCLYTSTLSSFEIIITSLEQVSEILNNLQSIDLIKREDIDDYLNKEIELDGTNSNLKLKVTNREIIIEYYENKFPHFRLILIKQFEHIIKILYKTIGNIIIESLHPSSWFSILWTPIKAHKSSLLTSTFLTYYQFNLDITPQNNQIHQEIPLLGILPIKFDNNIFMSKISLNNFNCHYGPNANMENPILLKKMIDNVFNNVIKNTSKTSVDYDYYLKTLKK